MKSRRPLQPVAPCDMQLLFSYLCPHCGRKNAVLAPTQPAQVLCDVCGQPFPLLPVDEHTVRFLKVLLADGRAAVDPDFV